MHHKHTRFSKFWQKIRNIFCWLFWDHRLIFGEIELMHGTHDLALPLEGHGCYACVKNVKEVWVSLDEKCSGLPVCGGDDGRNWVTVRMNGEEIRVTVDVRTNKVLLKWMILI